MGVPLFGFTIKTNAFSMILLPKWSGWAGWLGWAGWAGWVGWAGWLGWLLGWLGYCLGSPAGIIGFIHDS